MTKRMGLSDLRGESSLTFVEDGDPSYLIHRFCNALGDVLSPVEALTLDLRADGMPSNWENALDNIAWHGLLLHFVGLKKLCIGSSLTPELSKALELADEGLVLVPLPELQEPEVPLKIDHATNAFSMFMKTRESVSRPIHIHRLVPPEVIVGPSLSAKETVAELPPKSLATQAGPRPKFDDAERREKKRCQARALGLVGRLRGKN
jgi:hypothetical protein